MFIFPLHSPLQSMSKKELRLCTSWCGCGNEMISGTGGLVRALSKKWRLIEAEAFCVKTYLGSVGVPTGIVICKETSGKKEERSVRRVRMPIKATSDISTRNNVIPIILRVRYSWFDSNLTRLRLAGGLMNVFNRIYNHSSNLTM